MIEISIKASDADAWKFLEVLRGPIHRGRIMFTSAVIDRSTKITGDIKTMLLTDTQQVDLAIKPVDKKGNPAQVDGVPAWSSSNPDVATVTPAADGLSAVVKAANSLGSAQISVTADADLGQGVSPIAGTLDIEVVAGQAVGMTIIAGTPAEQA